MNADETEIFGLEENRKDVKLSDIEHTPDGSCRHPPHRRRETDPRVSHDNVSVPNLG
jgi:hypothetical protein